MMQEFLMTLADLVARLGVHHTAENSWQLRHLAKLPWPFSAEPVDLARGWLDVLTRLNGSEAAESRRAMVAERLILCSSIEMGALRVEPHRGSISKAQAAMAFVAWHAAQDRREDKPSAPAN